MEFNRGVERRGGRGRFNLVVFYESSVLRVSLFLRVRRFRDGISEVRDRSNWIIGGDKDYWGWR